MSLENKKLVVEEDTYREEATIKYLVYRVSKKNLDIF